MFNSIWYDELIKPAFNPPSEIFAPVWTILYILIFISLMIYIFTPAEQNKFRGYIYFTLQLVLNIIWTPIFFYYKNIVLALLIIISLDIFTYLTLRKFYSVSRVSGILLIPYLIWIIFATYLNVGFLLLN